MKRFSQLAALAAAALLCGRPCAGFSANGSGGSRIRPGPTDAPKDGGGGGGPVADRRALLRDAFAAAAALSAAATPPRARALDFDAFASGELSKDAGKASPELSDDEALCRYGAPGKSMGEACERARIKRTIPGGVDASGKVDRGDYLKCRYEYPIVDGKYVKTRVCKPSNEWPSEVV